MSETKFKRGAQKSPRHKLLSTPPFRPVAVPPPQFAVVPPQLSAWDNDRDGDCVTAEEAFAKAAYSVQCGVPELFVPDQEVIRWASHYGFLNGATLTEVMDVMIRDGFNVNGTNYKDGPYAGVDYSNEDVLSAAIFQGSVKIAIDANALPSGAGNGNGWYAISGGNYPNTDHCVALCGYGTAEFLFRILRVQLPQGLEPSTKGYLLFTWNSIGFVSHRWIMGTCVEAWVRNPTTPGTVPIPPPPPPPPPPFPPGPMKCDIMLCHDVPAGNYNLLSAQAVGELTTAVAAIVKLLPPGSMVQLPPELRELERLGAIPWHKIIQIVFVVIAFIQAGPPTPQSIAALIAQIQAILAS